jgi:organic radical activating enzyme
MNGGKLTSADMAGLVLRLWPVAQGRPRVVLTGGEPLLQVDNELVMALLAARCWLAVETNGTQAIPAGIDWVCVSPKSGSEVVLKHADEVKVVYPQEYDPLVYRQQLAAKHWSIQPRDGAADSMEQALAFVMAHPDWRLSLQLHKILRIS